MTALHPRIVSCKVLALEGSDRLEGFFERPGSEHFEVFRATDGRKGEGEELFDREAFRARYGREARPGEIGCAVSHYRILRQFVDDSDEGSDIIFVAEDDARLSRHAVRIVNRIVSRVKVLDIGLLAHPEASADKTIVTEPAQRWVRLSFCSRVLGWSGTNFFRFGAAAGIPCGAGCYLMTREAAQRYVDLVEAKGRIGWVADEFKVLSDEARNDFKFLRPNIAGWSGGTTIQAVPNVVFNGIESGILAHLREYVDWKTPLRLLRGNMIATGRQFGLLPSGRRSRVGNADAERSLRRRRCPAGAPVMTIGGGQE